MSTRVKIGVAAAIVAALVGLIVLDQRSASQPGERSVAAPSAPESRSGLSIETNLIEQAQSAIDRAAQQAVTTPRPSSPATAQPPAPATESAPPPAAESYEVKQGDSLWTIAEKKYGDGSLNAFIAKANNLSDHSMLRIGQKLVLPPKPATEGLISTDAVNEGSVRTYVIQSGDSLVKLATRFYSNAQLALKLYEANRDVIGNPDVLVAGTKIVLPEFSAAPEAPVVQPGDAVAPPGRRTYRVKQGDSLWKIAKANANGRSIQETMDRIRELNPEKLPTTGAALRVDWVIVLP